VQRNSKEVPCTLCTGDTRHDCSSIPKPGNNQCTEFIQTSLASAICVWLSATVWSFTQPQPQWTQSCLSPQAPWCSPFVAIAPHPTLDPWQPLMCFPISIIFPFQEMLAKWNHVAHNHLRLVLNLAYYPKSHLSCCLLDRYTFLQWWGLNPGSPSTHSTTWATLLAVLVFTLFLR
jgi:hypothetical protein